MKEIDGRYCLYIRSIGGIDSPAGSRLGRKDPIPVDRWDYTHKEDADRAAEVLQRYIDEYEAKKEKRIRKNKRLEEQEDKLKDYLHRFNVTAREAR